VRFVSFELRVLNSHLRTFRDTTNIAQAWKTKLRFLDLYFKTSNKLWFYQFNNLHSFLRAVFFFKYGKIY
jgi:hypothetical protein